MVCLKILFCDDDRKAIDELVVAVSEYMNKKFIKNEIVTTTSSKEVIESEEVFDLAFLDIQMDEADGLSVAKELKRRNGKVIIFFVTDYKEFQDDAMDLRVFRFYEKPFDVQRLYSGLDKAMEYLDETYVDIFVQQKGIQIKLYVDDIIYIKRENRKVTIVTKDCEYDTFETLEHWCDKLPTTFFFLVHKSFLVNLHYVTSYSYTELYLDKKIRIPVAPRKQADFHKYWFSYLRGR